LLRRNNDFSSQSLRPPADCKSAKVLPESERYPTTGSQKLFLLVLAER